MLPQKTREEQEEERGGKRKPFPITRDRAIELVATEGDNKRARKRRAAGFYGLVETAKSQEEWLDTARTIAENFAVIPVGVIDLFRQKRPSGTLDMFFEEAVLARAARILFGKKVWEKTDLTAAYRTVDILGDNYRRVKVFFQRLVDDNAPWPPKKLRDRVKIRWVAPTGFNNRPPAFFNNRRPPTSDGGGGVIPPDRLKKRREKSEADRLLRQKMRGISKKKEQNSGTSKRDRKAEQRKKKGK